MKVSVGNGAMVWVSWPAGCSVVLATDTLSATLIAPVGNPRIDVAQLDKHGNVEVVGGTEAGSPSAPSASADALKLAEIYMRVGMVSIKDSDDASNGYITDKRTYA